MGAPLGSFEHEDAVLGSLVIGTMADVMNDMNIIRF
jgi:hypothetical protein